MTAAPSPDALRAVLARVAARAPYSARTALDAAAAALRSPDALPGLRDASAWLRAEYERAAPPRPHGSIPGTREAHGARWRWPWTDPVDDPVELRPLAACVAAVYAVEAHATGERAGLVGYYLRAAGEWS